MILKQLDPSPSRATGLIVNYNMKTIMVAIVNMAYCSMKMDRRKQRRGPLPSNSYACEQVKDKIIYQGHHKWIISEAYLFGWPVISSCIFSEMSSRTFLIHFFYIFLITSDLGAEG